METENIWPMEETEKEEIIWRRKILFVEEKKSREGEGGKYLVKEDIIVCG